MRHEVFVVLLVSLSGTVAALLAEGNANTSKLDPQLKLMNFMIHGMHVKRPRTGFVSESFSMGNDPNYYDHFIDLSLQQLKLLKKEYPIEARIKQRGKHSAEMPVKGTIIFDGLHSLRTLRSRDNEMLDHTRGKRLANGDLVLEETFELGNISGIGKFSGLNSLKESNDQVFTFHPNPIDIHVSFVLTKDPSRKNVTVEFGDFHFQKPHGTASRENIKVAFFLEQKALNAFERLFTDLYNMIYEKMVLAARKNDPDFDKVLDETIEKVIRNHEPFIVKGNGTVSNRTAGIHNRWNLDCGSLDPLTKRLSKAELINTMNGDRDFQVIIQFGEVHGRGFIFHQTPEVTFNETFVFKSPGPVVVEAAFYLPRNRSFLAKAFRFVKKPTYIIPPGKNDRFQRVFQLLLQHNGWKMYPQVIYRFLNEFHKQVFPDTYFNQTNKNGN